MGQFKNSDVNSKLCEKWSIPLKGSAAGFVWLGSGVCFCFLVWILDLVWVVEVSFFFFCFVAKQLGSSLVFLLE